MAAKTLTNTPVTSKRALGTSAGKSGLGWIIEREPISLIGGGKCKTLEGALIGRGCDQKTGHNVKPVR